MPIHERGEHTSGHRTRRPRSPVWTVWAAGAVVMLALLLWPLQALLAGILIGTVAVLLEAFNAWLLLHVKTWDRATARRQATAVGAAIVGIGVVAAAIWTVPMAVATLLLALTACAVNAYARWSAHRTSSRITPGMGEATDAPAPDVRREPAPAPTPARGTPPRGATGRRNAPGRPSTRPSARWTSGRRPVRQAT